MSKEFSKEIREYYERTYDVTVEEAEYAHELGCSVSFPHPYSVQAAFTAGRALGRREMKGKAVKIMNKSRIAPHHYPIMRVVNFLADAIEAIPEEGV